jgi:opacity protein-like surface antigen
VLKKRGWFFLFFEKAFLFVILFFWIIFYRERVMLKKLVIAVTSAALLAGSSASFARYGVYLGGDIGGNVASWTTKDRAGTNVSFNNQGIIGTVFAGYGYNVDHFYVGIEGFFNQASNKSGTKNINTRMTRYISQKYGYGLSLLPGIAITDGAILYARLGVVRTNFQIHDSSPVEITPSSNTNITGSQAGAGVQVAIAPSLDVRGEYVYSLYGSSSNSDGRFTPRNSQANIGIVYKFE